MNKFAEPPVHVVQMMPALPGMYAVVGHGDRKTEYRLIVMWVLLNSGPGKEDIIGLTAEDIANGDLKHSGYEIYTTNVPKVNDENVKVIR